MGTAPCILEVLGSSRTPPILKDLVLSPFFFLTKNKPLLLFQLSSCSRSLPPFSQGDAEKCCLAFSSYAARFLLWALCVLVGRGWGRGRAGRDALILQFPVSGGLGP